VLNLLIREFADPSQANTKGSPSAERGAKIAENLRYGQAMSEQGVGGFTTPGSNDGGVGGGSEAERIRQSRKEQGYDAGREMDRNIGG